MFSLGNAESKLYFRVYVQGCDSKITLLWQNKLLVYVWSV